MPERHFPTIEHAPTVETFEDPALKALFEQLEKLKAKRSETENALAAVKKREAEALAPFGEKLGKHAETHKTIKKHIRTIQREEGVRIGKRIVAGGALVAATAGEAGGPGTQHKMHAPAPALHYVRPHTEHKTVPPAHAGKTAVSYHTGKPLEVGHTIDTAIHPVAREQQIIEKIPVSPLKAIDRAFGDRHPAAALHNINIPSAAFTEYKHDTVSHLETAAPKQFPIERHVAAQMKERAVPQSSTEEMHPEIPAEAIHMPEHIKIDKLNTVGVQMMPLQPIGGHAQKMETVKNIPNLPAVAIERDTVQENTDATAIPLQPGETADTDFSFDPNAPTERESEHAPVAAPVPAHGNIKASTSETAPRHKISVEYFDENNKPLDITTIHPAPKVLPPVDTGTETTRQIIPEIKIENVAPDVRVDSVFESGKVWSTDTTRAEFKRTITPEGEKHMKPQVSWIEKIPLGDGTFQAVQHFGSEGFKEPVNKETTGPDNKKVRLEGGIIVPGILAYRIDQNAWSKLESYKDINAERVYLHQVEQNEDIGPWSMDLKSRGVKMIFNEKNELVAELPFLFGESTSDSLNTYTTAQDSSGKTTPAGTYFISYVENKDKHLLKGQFGHDAESHLWLMLKNQNGTLVNQGIALHGERMENKEEQSSKIHSADAEDNGVTIGCERVDARAVKILVRYFPGKSTGGRSTYKQYILSANENVSLNPLTGTLESLTPAQVKSKILQEVEEYKQKNPIDYYVISEEVVEEKNGRGVQTLTITRDPKAEAKIQTRTIPDVPIDTPAFERTVR